MTNSFSPYSGNKSNGSEYKNLQKHQIEVIDEAISSLGDFGEVRLIVIKGRLRFMTTQKSYDMLKLQPGKLVKESR